MPDLLEKLTPGYEVVINSEQSSRSPTGPNSAQTAELAIKAVYQQSGWLFPFIHDMEELLAGLSENGLCNPADAQQAEKLSTYAVETRYPGLAPRVTDSEY